MLPPRALVLLVCAACTAPGVRPAADDGTAGGPDRRAEPAASTTAAAPEAVPAAPVVPVYNELLADARTREGEWLYLLEPPRGENWMMAGYDDSGWQRGLAGFGSDGTPGAFVRTHWSTPDIWLRRVFELAQVPE